MRFTREPTIINLEDLLPETLERLKNEPNLVVALVAEDGEPVGGEI